MTLRPITALLASLCLPFTVQAACPDDAEVAAFVADFSAVRPARGLPSAASLDDALCAQGKVVNALTGTWGPVAGYKAGLTNKAVQERFGVSTPVHAAMLRDMLLTGDVELPASFGARPMWEADLVAVVKKPGLHKASTPLEALEYIESIVPFIELPDLMLAPDVKITGPALVAINVGTRLGVLGRPLRAENHQAFADALAQMAVVIEVDGTESARASGSVLMDNPLNSALWLARSLHDEGVELTPGQMLSLGSFLPPQPPKAGTAVTVRYLGLPGDPTVSLRFKP